MYSLYICETLVEFHSTVNYLIEMNIEFGTSNRGRPTLLYQGYEYVKKQETNTTTHWICRHYRQIKCSSLVITSVSEIIKTPKDHICNFKPGATEARQAKNKTEKTYHDFTQALLQLIPNANPERILMDFEKAAVNASAPVTD